jgi:hypothetical protein
MSGKQKALNKYLLNTLFQAILGRLADFLPGTVTTPVLLSLESQALSN